MALAKAYLSAHDAEIAKRTWQDVIDRFCALGKPQTQEHPPVRYDAIQDGLRVVATKAKELGASVHMPRIGCGLAGGKWDEVERIIREELTAPGVAVTVYDLPQRQAIEGTSQKP